MCLSLYSGSSYGSGQITVVTFCPSTFTYVFTNAQVGSWLFPRLATLSHGMETNEIRQIYLVVRAFIRMTHTF